MKCFVEVFLLLLIQILCQQCTSSFHVSSGSLIENDMKSLSLVGVLGTGTRNFVFSTSRNDTILRMCLSIDHEMIGVVSHSTLYKFLDSSTDPFVKNVTVALQQLKNENNKNFSLLPYSYVKDEFVKSLEFSQTQHMHLSILSPMLQFDVVSGCLNWVDGGECSSVILSFQFNKRLTGDIDSRPASEWREIDIKNLLYGYFQSQLKVLQRTKHYHTDGHPKNILYDGNVNPAQFYLNDFGFTSGWNRGDSIHSGQSLHPSYLTASRQVFQLLERVSASHSESFKFVTTVYAKHNASIAFTVDNYFRLMLASVEESFEDCFDEDETLTFAQQGTAGFILKYVRKRLTKQDLTIAQQNFTISDLRRTVAQQDVIIAQQNVIIAQQNTTISALQSHVFRLEATIVEQGTMIKELRGFMDEWRAQDPNLSSKKKQQEVVDKEL